MSAGPAIATIPTSAVPKCRQISVSRSLTRALLLLNNLNCTINSGTHPNQSLGIFTASNIKASTPTMASATQLSFNDNAVLGALFDPESSLSNSTQVSDNVPSHIDSSRLEVIQQNERRALLPLNHENPSQDEIRGAIMKLDDIISGDPAYASAWNNRAQTRRMLYEIEELYVQIEELKLVLRDLAQAIELATPKNPLAPLSALDARVLASAHTHRGYLLYTASKSDHLTQLVTTSVDSFFGLGRDGLEEMASREFTLGGRYGNDTARQLAVRTNPYAKLCGSIVKEAMQKELADYHAQVNGVPGMAVST